ncbi:MAG: hypothetical protein ACYSWO_25155 [Planctomycetota bacterium]|jgi:hypothetical protein
MVFSGKRSFWPPMVMLLLLGYGSAFAEMDARALSTGVTMPYRVLVVIGDQWDDPASYNIDSTRVSGDDFRDVITMLKIWGIPFDILRLDQQRLQINRFLNGIAGPNYACVIWMADPDKLEGYSAHYETLRRVVEDYGISLIALFDYIKTPGVAELLGVDYSGLATTAAENKKQAFVISTEHFITAGMAGTVLTGDSQADITAIRCEAKGSTKVLGTLAGYPQLVVTDLTDDVKTVWIGGGRDWFGRHAVARKIFRNSLVYCMGVGLFSDNFENAFIFVMDDMGASEHAYSLRWHYPTPSRETIVKYLVEPLDQYGFVIVQNVTPGYANPLTRMVESPWAREKFTDPFGNVQDYASTKEGLDEGLSRGVFEIHPHRVWTHQTWDMDSPPGPWWDAPIEGERADGRWYTETYDARRDMPVPSNDMLFLYKVGRSAVELQFGVTPLGVTIRPRKSLHDDNGRLAAIAGFGLGTSSSQLHYLGADCTIEFSMMYPERLYCHDLDLLERIDSEITGPYSSLDEQDISALRSAPVVGSRRIDLRSGEWIKSRKDRRWMGYNEVCAYVHSDIDIQTEGALTIQLDYDGHYSRYFSNHESTWTLELSDRYRKKLGKNVSVIVDGKSSKITLTGSRTITIPPGVGTHKVEIRSDR